MEIVEKPSNPKFEDLEGQKFNRLLVIAYAGKIGVQSYWWCKCDCGNNCKVQSSALKGNYTVSCGCYRKQRVTTHGKSISPEYNSFNNAKNRCNNPNDKYYSDYGNRGIEFRFNSFEEFLAEIGEKPKPKELYSVERINNEGHYESGNIKWALANEQSRNKRMNHNVTFNSKTQCLTDWAKDLKINVLTLFSRINDSGWCINCAFTIPVKKGGRWTEQCPHKKI